MLFTLVRCYEMLVRNKMLGSKEKYVNKTKRRLSVAFGKFPAITAIFNATALKICLKIQKQIKNTCEQFQPYTMTNSIRKVEQEL